MNEYSKIFFKCEVNLVVCILDDYTSKPIAGKNVSVYIEGIKQKPVNKKGCFVFINLENGVYKLKIDSEHYYNEVIEIDTVKLKSDDSVLYVRLRPMPSYPFDAGAGLLRMKFIDTEDKPIKNTQVNAFIVSKENYRAKIVQKKVKKGDEKLPLICAGGYLTHGETLYIADEDKSEECTIEAYDNYDEGIIKLRQPLNYEHAQGTLLMPAVITFTDDRGEAVIYFKNFSIRMFEIRINMEYRGKSLSINYTVEEGKSIYLGHIKL
ncbi:MAG: hypothetical protein ACOZCL_06535 [Bacillota bacterium]